jgi:hypothetical protein
MPNFMDFGSRQISLVKCSQLNIALVVFLLCAGEDLPPSGDPNEGCQWKVRTDEGWVSYWDS